MIQAVADGQFDAAADGITITEDRAEIVDFSDGYINIDQRLLVRLDEDRIESIEDIVADEELLLGTQTGTTNYETADSVSCLKSASRLSSSSPSPCRRSSRATLTPSSSTKSPVKVIWVKTPTSLKLVGPSMSSDQLGFIYPLGSDLVEPVNAALKELKANGFLEEVNLQYFGPEFNITYDDLEG